MGPDAEVWLGLSLPVLLHCEAFVLYLTSQGPGGSGGTLISRGLIGSDVRLERNITLGALRRMGGEEAAGIAGPVRRLMQWSRREAGLA